MLLAHHRLFHRALFALDLAAIGASLQVSALIVYRREGVGTPLEIAGQTVSILIFWFVVSTHAEVYRSWRTGRISQELVAVFKAALMALALGASTALFLWENLLYDLLSAAILMLLFLGVQRYLMRLCLHRLRFSGRNYRNVALVGHGPAAPRLIRDINENQHYGIRLCGYVAFPSENGNPQAEAVRLGDVDRLNEIISQENVDLVLVCPSVHVQLDDMNRVFALCDQAGVQCLCTLDFSVRNLHPTASVFAGSPVISFNAHRPAQVGVAVKRALDTVAAGIAILLLAPFGILVSALIRIYDGGPVFFKQRRIGEGGRPFTCYKFRTMCVNAENMKAELLCRNEQDGPVFKIRNDPRITPIGRFLRKYSLDELPQLLNVFTGDMSLVGPRPPTPEEVQQYEWSQRRRFSVRPGITCIWQVEGRNKVDFKRWVEMDLYYIDNWSLMMDLRLLWRTVAVVARGTGM